MFSRSSPAKSRRELVVDVPLTEYRRTHKDVIAKVHTWVSWFVESTRGRMPDQNDIEQFAQTASFEIVSQLRRAAGLAKVTAAHDLIADHLNGTGFEDGSDGVRRWNRPLIIWTHHLDVAAALLEQVADAEAIIGSTTDRERDAIVERFQDGRVPVLVAAITKAGVGLTLTRSSDAIFVEVDWTPPRSSSRPKTGFTGSGRSTLRSTSPSSPTARSMSRSSGCLAGRRRSWKPRSGTRTMPWRCSVKMMLPG